MLNTYLEAFQTALKNYCDNGKTNTPRPGYLFGYFSGWRHDYKVYPDLATFQTKISTENNDHQAKKLIEEFLTHKNATFNNHSFRTYFLAELCKINPEFEKYYPDKKRIQFYQGTVYRGLMVGKKIIDEIFDKGHEDRSPAKKVEEYAADTSGATGISTSKDREIARQYAHFKRVCPKSGTLHQQGGFLLAINYRGLGGIDIHQTHTKRNNTFTAWLARDKQEVNIVGKIQAHDIKGAWYVSGDGLRGQFYENPRYLQEIVVKPQNESLFSRLAALFKM